MLAVIGLLLLAPAVGLADAGRHGGRDRVGIHDHLALGVAGCASHGLDQAGLRAQEALFISVQNRHEANLGDIQSFAQEVDAHQHVKGPGAQIPDDLHTLDGADVVVHIPRPDAGSRQVLGQILGHFLGQRGHEGALVFGGAVVDFADQIVDLPLHRPYKNLGIQQAGGSNDLLGQLACAFALPGSGGRRHVYALVNAREEFVKGERPVVIGRRQAEAVVYQCVLPGPVAAVHGPHLGQRHMALIHEEQKVLREIVQQGHGRRARRAV